VLAPKGAIQPTGTWSLGARAGDFVFIAGMRGIDPVDNKLVEGDEARIRQAFMNMRLIAGSEGASLADFVRLTVFVTDMGRLRPLVNKVQEALWGGGPYPPRTIIGQPTEPGRYIRGRGHILCPEKPVNSVDALGLAVTFLVHISTITGAHAAQQDKFHGNRTIHRQ
jgi:enamine deaminase RidA (YjgF/YER057c/UK114 family)